LQHKGKIDVWVLDALAEMGEFALNLRPGCGVPAVPTSKGELMTTPMRSTRQALVRPLVAAALLALAVPASATIEPPNLADPTCQILPDATGDAAAAPGDEDSAQLDIVSGAIGVSGQHVVVAINLLDLASPEPVQPYGRTYEFNFSIRGQNFFFRGAELNGGPTFSVFSSSQKPAKKSSPTPRPATDIGEASGLFDINNHVLYMRAPRGIFESSVDLSIGTVINNFAAVSYWSPGIAPPMTRPDDAVPAVAMAVNTMSDYAGDASSYFEVGQPSCLDWFG
jgi:hypothetical protein